MIPRCSGVWAAEDSLDGVCMVIVGSAIYTRADHDDFHVYATREIDGTRGRVTTTIPRRSRLVLPFGIMICKHEPRLIEDM